VSTAQQLGSAVGLAIRATVAANAAGQDPSTASFAGGLRVGFGMGAGLIAAALALTVVVLAPSTRREQARRSRENETVAARGTPGEVAVMATEARASG